MKNKTTVGFIILFILGVLGMMQFSEGVRSVDVVGLFASGALTGAAVTGFFTVRRKQ